MKLSIFTSSVNKSIRLGILERILISSLSTVVLSFAFIYGAIYYFGFDTEIINSFLYNNIYIIIASSIGASLAVTLVVGYPFTNDIKDSIVRIEDALNSLNRGRIDIRLEADDYKEFSSIYKSYNSMGDQVQRQVESLQRLVDENKKILQNAEATASMGERKKIARDLHDSISQQLFAISITMGAIKNIIEKKPAEAKKHFENVEKMVHLAQQELRALLMHLRPLNLNGTPLDSGIIALLKELKEKNKNINIKWDIQETGKLSQGIEDNIFRVLQEAISNVLRHSKASLLTIKTMKKNNLMLVYIEDNGIGFDSSVDKKTSYGIVTMQERIAEIGGVFSLITYPGKGTRIEIRVPIEINKEE